MSVPTVIEKKPQSPDLPADQMGWEERETWKIGITFPASDVPRRRFPRNRDELDLGALFAGAASGGPVALE